MCGPDHPAPEGDYTTHEGIAAALADDNFVTEVRPAFFLLPVPVWP